MLESYHEADMHLYGRKDGFIPMVEDFIVYHGDIGPSDRVETSAPITVSVMGRRSYQSVHGQSVYRLTNVFLNL